MAPRSSNSTDELAELSRQAISGDARALRALLTELMPHLLRVARRVLGPSHPFVEDAAHEAAYTVVSELGQYRGEGSLLNFSRGVALHAAMNLRRRDQAKKRAGVRASLDADSLEAPELDPEARLEHSDVLPAVRDVLDKLPDALAETFILSVLLGHTVGEIAEITGAPLDTAKSRLRLAMERFKERARKHPVLRDLVELER